MATFNVGNSLYITVPLASSLEESIVDFVNFVSICSLLAVVSLPLLTVLPLPNFALVKVNDSDALFANQHNSSDVDKLAIYKI